MHVLFKVDYGGVPGMFVAGVKPFIKPFSFFVVFSCVLVLF